MTGTIAVYNSRKLPCDVYILTDSVSSVAFAQFFLVWHITGHKVKTCTFYLFSHLPKMPCIVSYIFSKHDECFLGEGRRPGMPWQKIGEKRGGEVVLVIP
jgi:hypothetical protein